MGYYTTNFEMMQRFQYSLTELDGMMPWEREVYVGLLNAFIKKENERIERENNEMKARSRSH